MDVEHLGAKVGTSKNHREGGGQGRTISLIGCGASGAYAPGPDDEEEEEDELAYKQQLTVVTNFAICHHLLSAAAQFAPHTLRF
jgi:hypothetical protein